MIFDILLYASAAICFIGISYKIILWTKNKIGYYPFSDTKRFSGLIHTVFATIFSVAVIKLIKPLIFDILLQTRILKTSMLGWVMHILIFIGFLALVFMHAMDSIISENFFPYYYPTVNPYFFLRSLFGIMVIAGILIAVYRRYISKPARLKNAKSDLFAIVLVFIIIISGMALEGMKMTSISEFTAMVDEYAGLDYEDEDVIALETYWVKEFALVSARIVPPFEPDTLALGVETHDTNCMDCHSPNKSAFSGYAAAKLIAPAALFLDKINGVNIFYYLHIISCFAGLALIPFTKMFHMVATPISLLTNAVKTSAQTDNNNLSGSQLTKQILELDACTHCGTCNNNCSAGMIYEHIQNDYILPSEKMLALKKTSNRQKLNSQESDALFQGLYLCTNCDRCTVVCPSGIHLKSLWVSSRENLIKQHFIDQPSVQQNQTAPLILTGFSFIRGLNKNRIEKKDYDTPLVKAFETLVQTPDTSGVLNLDDPVNKSENLIDRRKTGLPLTKTFSHCFGCQSCSTICPVVAEFDRPQKQLTLLPHQIMYSLGLGMIDLAKGSAMLWNCLSCYQCQENCPQNVSVCDILFALKNRSFNSNQDFLS